MNPFNRVLSHLHTDATDQEGLSDEELKKGRIQFHRDHVRNGPSFGRGGNKILDPLRSVSPGEQRRANARHALARGRKTNRRYRKSWMDGRGKLATLRGHLIILGVLECKLEGTTFTEIQRRNSGVWVVEHFGVRDEDNDIVTDDDMLAKAVANATEAFVQQTRPSVTA